MAQGTADLAAGTGDAQTGHDIQKSLGFFGDHGNAVFRGRGDHRDQVHTVLMAGGRKLLFFLIGQVGQDQPVNADLRAGGDEPLCAVGEHDICMFAVGSVLPAAVRAGKLHRFCRSAAAVQRTVIAKGCAA